MLPSVGIMEHLSDLCKDGEIWKPWSFWGFGDNKRSLLDICEQRLQWDARLFFCNSKQLGGCHCWCQFSGLLIYGGHFKYHFKQSTLSRTIIYEKNLNKKTKEMYFIFEFCKLKKIAQSYKCFQKFNNSKIVVFKILTKSAFIRQKIVTAYLSIHVYYCYIMNFKNMKTRTILYKLKMT